VFAEIQRVIAKIPRGKVATYGAVAQAAGYEGAARQVVWALRNAGGRLPWHRVLGSGGRILLTGAKALEQRFRLEAEGLEFRGSRVRMDVHEHRFAARRRAR